jgi:SHS2 domain-containing protein
MPHTFFDHTGDVGVRLRAPALPGLFQEAALAFTETLTDAGDTSRASYDDVRLDAPTLDDLLVEWLTELLYRFEVRNLLPVGADLSVTEAPGGWQLRGTVASDTFDPDRHPIKVAVKGITYHQLDVRRAGEGWETSVVFDI